MPLPKKFEKRVSGGLGLHAVWLPGDPVEIGDVLTRKDGIFRPIDNLSSFGVEPDLQEFPEQRSLNFQASGTRTTTFQGGAEINPSQIQANASASVEITFGAKESYFIRTPELTGCEIENVRSITRVLSQHPEWRHGKFFVAWQLYTAKGFTFLGSQEKNSKIGFSGKGSAILKFLRVGATTGLTRTSTTAITVDLAGKGGPIVMALLRTRRDGEVVFV